MNIYWRINLKSNFDMYDLFNVNSCKIRLKNLNASNGDETQFLSMPFEEIVQKKMVKKSVEHKIGADFILKITSRESTSPLIDS